MAHGAIENKKLPAWQENDGWMALFLHLVIYQNVAKKSKKNCDKVLLQVIIAFLSLRIV